jgi:hypothetical protein
MDRKQYIQSLREQGYTTAQIMQMVEEKFPQIEQPSFIQDPVKTETSMGSKEDTVSKSEDGSLVSLTDLNKELEDKKYKDEFGILPEQLKKDSYREIVEKNKAVSYVSLPDIFDEYPGLEKQLESGELTAADLNSMGLKIKPLGNGRATVEVQSAVDKPVEISVKKRAPEKLTWPEKKFGKNPMTNLYGDIVRSAEMGLDQGGMLDASLELYKQGTTKKETKEWLKKIRSMEETPSTDEMIQFSDDYARMEDSYGSLGAFVRSAWRSPSALLQFATQSMANMAASLQSGEAIAIAGTSAAAGAGTGAAVAGPAGAITGGISMFMGGLSGTMETGFTLSDLLKEEVESRIGTLDKKWDEMTDDERFEAAWPILQDENSKKELRSRAIKRGVTIGAFDAATGMITQGTGTAIRKTAKTANRVAFNATSKAGRVASRTTAKVLPTITEATIETAGGMASEYAGQKAAGQEISVFDILQEGLVGKEFTMAGVARDAVATKGTYKINGQKLKFTKFAEAINSFDDEAFEGASIEVDNDEVVSKIISNRKEDIAIDQNIDSKISDANDRAELIKLERQIKELKSSESETNKNKVISLKEKVKAISDRYADSDIDVDIEDRKLAVARASRNRVEREFNGYAERVSKASESLGESKPNTVILENDEAVVDYLKSKGLEDLQDEMKLSEQQGLFVPSTNEIIINKNRSIEEKAVTVASHELLHSLLLNTVKNDPSNAVSLGRALLSKLNSINIDKIQNSDFKKRMELYADNTLDVQMEEALTLFSDAIATGDIKFEENTFTKIGDNVRRTLQRFGVANIKFNNGRDVYNFIKDYSKSIEKGELTKAQIKLAEEGAEGKLLKSKQEDITKTDKQKLAKSERATVLEEINKLIPESVQTQADLFSDARTFTKIYNAIDQDGGVINNYIKSRSSSTAEAELAIESVKDRLMNFDPQAKRKDGSTIGIEGFGEFIFANTAFGKLDAKKKLYQESQRKAQETSIDESVKQIADVPEAATEETTFEKRKAVINPLKFTGTPEKITLSDKPGKGLTFKNVGKKYAGEVGEQILGIPAKKITEASANLGSVNEARAIQQFFFKADNLEKFLKILPETNIALPEAKIGLETLDVSKQVKGTGLGIPKRVLDYFYEDFIDPTGKLTSPKGRSKGLTSQVPVKRLKPEFRGTISNEVIDKLKRDIGITPRGELNILPKGELRSPIGQLLKGLAKTYSTLAANTLVRQELQAAGVSKQEVADIASGKRDIMLSKSNINESKNVFMKDDSFIKSSEEFAAQNKSWKAIIKPFGLTLLDSKNEVDVEDFRNWTSDVLTTVLPEEFFTKGTFANAGTSAAKRGFFFINGGDMNSVLSNAKFAPTDEDITATVKRETYNKLEEKINSKDFRERQDKSINGLKKIFKAFEKLIKQDPENIKYIASLLSSTSQSMAHFVRTAAPITFYSKVTEGTVEEHTLPASIVAKYLLTSVLEGKLDENFENIKKNYQQGLLSKVDDHKLKGFKPNGKPYNYIASTPEGWKITDNIFARYFNENVANTNGGIDPNNIVLFNGNTIVQEYGIDTKGFRTNESLEKSKSKALAANKVRVMASKSTSNNQLLNDLKNRDKALRNAKNAKAERKGITVFDFDDTLAESKSLVGVTMPDGEFFKIDATRFAKEGEALLEQGAEFDFSDFSKVVDGKPGPLISKLEKAISKFGNKDVYVLTARPANSATAIHEFLKGLGYELPLENITGLANSSPEAKANWMVEKAALGYNDFYFVDDAYKNVKAVQDAMSVLDVKSKERIVYKDRFDKLDKEFNDILEAKTGIGADKEYSDAKAEVVGVGKGKFKFFIPPSADDFVGLLYSTLGKGKLGENQMAWYKKNLLDPYTRAMNNISNERMSLAADYKVLKKQLGIVPKKLRDKVKGEGFTKEQAIRIYIWNKQGFDVPGLSKTDLNEMTKYVEKNSDLQVFADQLIEITKGDGYAYPGETWLAGSITTDLLNTLQVTKRAKHLEEWQANVDVIFSKKNLNKLEAAYGTNYRKAMENMLTRMKTGKNRNFDGDSLTGRFLDWLNGSTGAIMFFNTRSAVLQTISAVNFINWSDNNIFKASAAFANQPQYWKDFVKLFNSDFLRERRDNLTININESDIAEMANKGGVKGAISYILQKGFLPTQFADSFAIASGGSTFYRNRIKTYLKEGMSQKEAEEKAFDDFREATEESQQSSRPDRISQQQAGPLGRVVLAFANTPSQYARIIKKASMDLAAGRGDIKTNLSKIMYYSVVQGFIFSALQSALFAADFDDEEEMDDKIWRMGNSVVDGILRGIGVGGAAATVVKNATLKTIEETEKKSPRYEKIAMEFAKLSPPVSSKLSKIQQAAREIQWNMDEVKTKGWSLENPAWLASANVLSATTNIPADRVIKKVNNIDAAINQDIEMIERLALIGGWQAWELGLDKKEEKEEKPTTYRRSTERKTIKRR